jgi:spermidine/putrescine transport system permease protein
VEQSWRAARGLFATLFAGPLLWLALFFLVPMAVIWAYSFGENRSLTEIAVTGSLHNYARALQPLYLGVLWRSALFAAITTLICLVVGFPVALALSFASPRARLWLLMGVMLPFWTNLLIRTYALMALLRSQGYVNASLRFLWHGVQQALTPLGGRLPAFEPLPLMHNDFGVVFGLVYVQLPFMILPLFAALDRLDRSLLEASLDLGAGQLTTLLRVVAPLIAPGIGSGVILTFIPSLGAYLTPDLLGGPDSQMIASVIERQFKMADDWPFGSALSFLLVYLTFLALAAQGLISRRGRA